MEVHPPHGALHSWKDFWIPLGTITIGLLIAISLEQSVEKLHHLHRLEQDFREEAALQMAFRDASILLSCVVNDGRQAIAVMPDIEDDQLVDGIRIW